MDILFLAFEFPFPLDRGGRIKTFYYLKALAEHHRVTLVTFGRTSQEQQYLDQFTDWLQDVHLVPLDLSMVRKMLVAAGGLWRRKPFVMELYNAREMHDLVSRLLKEHDYDLIYADHLHMSQYAPVSSDVCLVIDQHNVETEILRRFFENCSWGPLKAFSWWEWRRMAVYEPAECRRADMIIVTTPVDADTVRPWLHPEQCLEVLPIGVDTEFFMPQTRSGDSHSLVSMGTLSWQPNADGVMWFCQQVLPLLRAQIPDVRLDIIGDRAPALLVKMAEQDDAVSLLGRVEDVRPFLARSAALVVPLRIGSGMRVKVISTLAAGVPVVSTSVGCEGIAVTHGQDIMIADTASDFAQSLVRLMTDSELGRRLASAGRSLATARYGWSVVSEQITNVFASIDLD